MQILLAQTLLITFLCCRYYGNPPDTYSNTMYCMNPSFAPLFLS